MHFNKAFLFDDRATADKIIRAQTPYQCKQLGRKVNQFDQAKWNREKDEIAYTGNLLKFRDSDNADQLKAALMSTGSTEIIAVVNHIKAITMPKSIRANIGTGLQKSQNKGTAVQDQPKHMVSLCTRIASKLALNLSVMSFGDQDHRGDYSRLRGELAEVIPDIKYEKNIPADSIMQFFDLDLQPYQVIIDKAQKGVWLNEIKTLANTQYDGYVPFGFRLDDRFFADFAICERVSARISVSASQFSQLCMY
jgi:ribA/ribD-fused uncharacterized protein